MLGGAPLSGLVFEEAVGTIKGSTGVRWPLTTLVVIVVVSSANAVDEPWRIVNKVWDDCSTQSDVAGCLQGKAVTFMDRAARAESISFGDAISVVRTKPLDISREGKALSDNDVEEAGKEGRLTDLLWDRAARFLSSHTVKVNLPKISAEDLKSGVEEGRGKMKKMMGTMMMMGAMKAMALIPIALGVLFLLAGKALIIAKIALVLSLIITLKKLLSAKQEEHGGWQSSGGHGGGWDRRSMESSPIAHNLAYNAYKPQ
ncbi:Protein of unknown function (DUF1676) [Nesidiocoris tenuis]|uniref:Uncharacterized protein n=1 Tax=Nesidiocoris tenuis TaxID=355587 RepID=A0ABN7AYB1_9HEMI|nr:Protein of unknown function (DUF1676) [Nesidiocoris tenuis]